MLCKNAVSGGHDGGVGSLSEDARSRLEALWAAHQQQVHAYALRRTDPDSADDVLAETFAVAGRRLGDIPDDALPFLLATARRVLANQRRGDRRRRALTDRLQAGARTHPPVLSDGALAAALRQLSQTDVELLLLIAWEGLSGPEAARVVGCATATVHVRLHRARRRLARALAEQQRPSPETSLEVKP